MQREIQALVVALFNEQKKEAEVLQGILASIAVGGAARRAMIRDIANAVARAEGISDTAGPGVVASTASSPWYEGDVATAIKTIRARSA